MTRRNRGVSHLLTLLLFLLPQTGCATPNGPHRQPPPPTKGVHSSGYAIQFGAFSDIGNAERLVRRLNERKIDAFYFRKENGLYAVRFGDYPTREEAVQVADRLVRERLITSYFIDNPKRIRGLTPVVPEIRKAPPPQIVSPGSTATSPSRGDRGMGEIAARTAERFVGIPYRWGGDTVVDGMDCSGFVRAVFSLCGVTIPRTSAEQFRTGREVDRDDLQDGDLLFFGSSPSKVNHVGIYVGKGKFVHAPRRGEEIRISEIDDEYFARRFVGARRYF